MHVYDVTELMQFDFKAPTPPLCNANRKQGGFHSLIRNCTLVSEYLTHCKRVRNIKSWGMSLNNTSVASIIELNPALLLQNTRSYKLFFTVPHTV